MISKSTAVVEFAGGRSRVAPLAWAQQVTWDLIQEWLPEIKPFYVLTRWLPVPLLLSLDEVLAQLGELMVRHEATRTLYHRTASGAVVQEVLSSGSVVVEVFDRPAGDPEDFTGIVTGCLLRLGATLFDHETEVPVRISVALHEGIPVLVVFGISHLSADYTSAGLLATELAAMLRARADGRPAPRATPAWQPADLAAFENSPEGQLLGIESLRYLREQLARMAPDMLPARRTPVSPRFVRERLESDAIPVALRLAARRFRTSTSVILLAITTALVRCFCPGPVYPLDIIHSNRVRPELLATVTTMNQGVRAAVSLAAATFGELVAESAELMNTTRRHARFDGRAAREVIRSRGAGFGPGCQFNDMWSALPGTPGTRRGTAADLERLATATTLDRTEETEAEGMALFLDARGTAERIELFLMADTALLSTEEIHAALHTFERIAITVAETDIPLSRIARLLGPTPV